MRSLAPNPSCRYQPGETLPASQSDTNHGEREGFLEGLRTWQQSCPCCFSSIRPDGVPTGLPMPLEDDDVAYVRREFVPLPDACTREGISLAQLRGLVHDEQLPKPPYVLPNGTEMVSDDYFDCSMMRAASRDSMSTSSIALSRRRASTATLQRGRTSSKHGLSTSLASISCV
jgi:hypothetical protein